MLPFSPEHNRRVRQRLAEQGVEMTPAQIVQTRKQAFATIRAEMRKLGHTVPDSDEELLKLMVRAGKST